MTAQADTRYSFVGQHLEASAIFVRRLQQIEAAASFDEQTKCEHRGLVCSVIFQCAAALETEAHETCVYGPGSYLGGDGTDRQAQAFLAPLADLVDRQRTTLYRFELILQLLRRPPISGDATFGKAKLLIQLRNEIAHYKSLWGAEMEGAKLFATLHTLKHRPPPFIGVTQNFFPHRCLSADCAAWALRTAFSNASIKRLVSGADLTTRI